MRKGSYIKYDSNAGGAGWQIAFTIIKSDVKLFGNNDVILRSEWERGSKRHKMQSYFNEWPLNPQTPGLH